MLNRCQRIIILTALHGWSLASTTSFAAGPDAPDPGVFLQRYCIECHGAEKQKGDRRFDQLTLPATTVGGVIDLQDIIDQMNLGEMPPKNARQPEDAERGALIATLNTEVVAARARLRSTGGQTVLRRLNRREYANTVGTLFALNMRGFDPTVKFPGDQIAEQMDNLGDVLQTSGHLLVKYFEAADLVVEKALGVTEPPQEQRWTFKKIFEPQDTFTYAHRSAFGMRYLCVYEAPDAEYHQGGYGVLHEFQKGVPYDGYYEISVKAQAMNRRHPYDPAIFGRNTEEPFRMSIVPGDERVGDLYQPQPLEPELATVLLSDGDPQWYKMTVWLDAGRTPRFTFPNGTADSRSAFVKVLNRHRETWPKHEQDKTSYAQARRIVLTYGQMPHIRIEEVQIRGPIIRRWPLATQRAVLGDRPFTPDRTREILKGFADRAYRHPASDEEMERLMGLVEARVGNGATPFEALKAGLKAVLCAPEFLYLIEPGEAGAELSAHALASRLSYFLWASPPDAELRGLANSGELVKTDVLLAQTRRLLASKKSAAFVQGFLDSWLNLRSLGEMLPDRGAFGVYYTRNLQVAMKRETQLFMQHLIETNGSVTSFLDSDYTFVNQPLATLYGLGQIGPVEAAHEFRQIKLRDPRRGGLLGQAAVLTVSANGVETSPVTRGVWILNNILGTPPAPPPDDVPTVDPDVRGAMTLREVLTKHRSTPACFDCHQKIDPLGFALENFDPIGAWRTHYRVDKSRGPIIDASGQLPNGQKFDNIIGLKKILVSRQDQFARMLTERLLSYASGRRIEAVDRPEVDEILAGLANHDKGLRSLIELVVTSRPFRTK
ncbi:MAG: DUF1592 domain-containing protein [Roseimicrobium sp.]